MKLRLNAAKELAFMQGNMVLHRVLKPDDVLVFSFVWAICLNDKLRDFGWGYNDDTPPMIVMFVRCENSLSA